MIETLPDHDWLVVQTRPQQEKQFAREMRLWDIPGLLFLEERELVYKTARRITQVPLLGGYVFVHHEFYAMERLWAAGRTLRVLRVIQPALLRQDLLDLHQLITAVPLPVVVLPRIQPGTRVRLTAGSLAGTTGVVVRHAGACALVVNVHALGHSVAVQVGEQDVAEFEELPVADETPVPVETRAEAIAS